MGKSTKSQIINSRAKGKTGELEFAHYLASNGFAARRGVQYSGGHDSPDVVCEDLPDIHWEVKRVEGGNLYKWMDQAMKDAGLAKIPVVAHRKNHKDWVAIVPMETLMELLKLREISKLW